MCIYCVTNKEVTPGVDSASNRNEYQEYFLGEMRPLRRADNLTTYICRLSRNLGALTSWNPQGLSRPVMGLLYLYLYQRSNSITGSECRISRCESGVYWSPESWMITRQEWNFERGRGVNIGRQSHSSWLRNVSPYKNVTLFIVNRQKEKIWYWLHTDINTKVMCGSALF
jgi:hypothetical protein